MFLTASSTEGYIPAPTLASIAHPRSGPSVFSLITKVRPVTSACSCSHNSLRVAPPAIMTSRSDPGGVIADPSTTPLSFRSTVTVAVDDDDDDDDASSASRQERVP